MYLLAMLIFFSFSSNIVSKLFIKTSRSFKFDVFLPYRKKFLINYKPVHSSSKQSEATMSSSFSKLSKILLICNACYLLVVVPLSVLASPGQVEVSSSMSSSMSEQVCEQPGTVVFWCYCECCSFSLCLSTNQFIFFGGN